MENDLPILIDNKVIADLLVQLIASQKALTRVLLERFEDEQTAKDLMNRYGAEALDETIDLLFSRYGHIDWNSLRP